MGTRRGLTSDIGSTGLNQGGWGHSEDFLTDWQETSRKCRAVREMLLNSAVIGALRLAIEMPIRDVDWFFTSDDGEDDPRLDLLNESFDNMSHSWNDHIVDALLFPFYGWSLFSIIYERKGGRLLWRKFKMLGHDTIMRWQMADDGGIDGVVQYPYLWPDPIPIDRLLLYRFRKTKNNPEGESVLRPAWPAWYYVKNIQQIEAIGIERNLSGLPVIEMPMGADPTESTSETTDYGRAAAIVRNIRNDEQAGIVLPPPRGESDFQRWRLSLMSGGGMSKVIDTNMVISRYEKRMLMAAMAQFLMLGMDNIGALATFEGATDFFAMSTNSVADIIAETFTKHAIPRLLAFNGMDTAGIALEHGRVGNTNPTPIIELLKAGGTFITFTGEDEMWLRGIFGMPEKTLEEITELREQAAAERKAMLPTMQPAQRDEQEQDDQDNMTWTSYAAGNAPDDDQRRKYERNWQRTMTGFWDKNVRRIMRDSRSLR